MTELQKYALSIATAQELKEAIYFFLKGQTYTFEQLFPNGIIEPAKSEEIECQPAKN